jgi:hypothetical protein
MKYPVLETRFMMFEPAAFGTQTYNLVTTYYSDGSIEEKKEYTQMIWKFNLGIYDVRI